MSRIGKNIIKIPNGVTIAVSGNNVSVKGPKGSLERQFNDTVEITQSPEGVLVKPKKQDIAGRAMWGTAAAHIKNMIKGVTETFGKKLIIEGVGYRSEVKGKNLVLSVGFSHPVTLPVPEGLAVTSEKGVMSISGIDKELVGLFAARVRNTKKPEPYKGKGIKYEGEFIRRKEGKKTA